MSTPHSKNWSAVIPAAGRGTRLGFGAPKILYPVLGKPLIQWLHELLSPLVSQITIVASPEGMTPIREWLEKNKIQNIDLILQKTPIGMADAVEKGLSLVSTKYALVLWGDQIAFRSMTLQNLMEEHQSRQPMALSLTSALREKSYIEIERDEHGLITNILQAREGDAVQPGTENDTGLFALTVSDVLPHLRGAIGTQTLLTGKKTGELNFLPLLPILETCSNGTYTIRLDSADEAQGINDPAEAERVAQILKERSAK